MNFSDQQQSPARRFVGFGVVVLFHIGLVYALVTGLAKKVVDVVRAPIETKVIEEIKKPPPPPEVVVPPPPKLEAPPPPFIPPPEVVVAPPPPTQQTIVAVTPTPPSAPTPIAPLPPPAQETVAVAAVPPPPAPAPPPPKPAATSTGNCAKKAPMEKPAVEVTNRVSFSMQGTIRGGKLIDVELKPGSFKGTTDRKVQRVLVNSAIATLQEYDGCLELPGDDKFLIEFVVNPS